MREFHELFAGRDDVYGTYDLSATPLPGEKRGGQARTVHGPVTRELFEDHLNGIQSIGIVPIMKDDTCNWFAIDVDSYGSDIHHKLARKIDILGLPLLLCNTKSGGAHLYCFLKKPTSAKNARAAAATFIRVLDLPENTEVFPKQETSEGSGNWINLPYFGKTRQYMGTDGQQELSLREFESAATNKSVWPSELPTSEKAKEVLQEENVPSDHSQAPPCIQDMFRFGVREGSRNNALMHMGVYFKRAFPDDWEDRLSDVNHRVFDEPLRWGETSALIASLQKTDYQYKCKDQPMVSMCDASLCKKMRFGIGEVDPNKDDKLNWHIDSLRQIGDREPVYIAMINGKEVRLSPDQLMSFNQFAKAVMIKLRIMPTQVKGPEFANIISRVMATMEYEDAPDAVNSDTQLIASFKSWVAEMMDDDGGSTLSLNNGIPYYDFDQKMVIFRPDDFFNYLRRSKFEKVEFSKAWVTFASYGTQDRKTAWAFPANPPWFDVEEKRTI